MSKIVLVAPQLGTGKDLLYWEPILSKLITQFNHEVSICTGCEFDGAGALIYQEFKIEYFNLFGFNVPNVSSIQRFFALNYDVAFLIEFNVLSILILAFSFFNNNKRAVILVENSPIFLSGINKIRFGTFFDWQRRLCCYLADKIVTNNEHGSEYLKKRLKVKEEKIIVGTYLSSSFEDCQRPKSESAGKVKMVAVGRLVKNKGFNNLIDEVASLPSKVQENLMLDIYGEGEIRSNLESLINEHNLSNVINLKGLVPYKELGSVLSDYDVFIMPTLGDYRSLVSFEAISLGLPILLSKYDGSSSEVLKEGGNGFSIDPFEKGSISSKIRYVAENQDIIPKISLVSRSLASKFTPFNSSSVLNNAITSVSKK